MFVVELRQIWGWEDNGPQWAGWWLNRRNYQFVSFYDAFCENRTWKRDSGKQGTKDRVCFLDMSTISWFFIFFIFLEGMLIESNLTSHWNSWIKELHGRMSGDFSGVCAHRDAVALHEPWEYFYGNCLEISAEPWDIRAAIRAHHTDTLKPATASCVSLQ